MPLHAKTASTPSTLLSRLYPHLRLAPLNAVRIAGFFPVLLVLILISLAYLTAVPATLLPLLPHHPLLTTPLLLIFHFLFLSTLCNYLLLILIDPGSPPSSWYSPPPPHPFPHAHLVQDRSPQGLLRYCTICSCYKPDRSHHCSICGRCILRMDHHCVFINNCVSFYNHKFFISFVSYAFISCLFIAAISFPTFSAIISTGHAATVHKPQSPHFPVFWTSVYHNVQQMSYWLSTLAMIGYITTSSFALALAVFVGLHFYLIAKGRTTIEMYELGDPVRARRVLQYDLGLAKNLTSVCGTVPLCWFCPTRAFVEGDGTQWERRELSEEQGPLAV